MTSIALGKKHLRIRLESATITLMDTDFTKGKNAKKVIDPVNDLSTPRLPDFEQIETTDESLSSGNEIIAEKTEPTEELSSTEPNETTTTPSAAPVATKTTLKQRWQDSRRFRIGIITGISAVILLISGLISFLLLQPGEEPPDPPKTKVTKKQAPPILSTFSGLPIPDVSVNSRPIIGVMIENSKDARPQSGIDRAGVVFEAIAEGGITRFLTLYQDTTPDHIGPVRSARPYYVQWCMSFDCAYGHVGGSPEALQNIRSWGTKDLDQFSNGGSYQRSNKRYAPHNVYTSFEKLQSTAGAKGFGAPSYIPFTRKADSPSKTPDASQINVNISSALYNSSYSYDNSSNSYRRSQGGAPHEAEAADGAKTQIQPKSIVVLTMGYRTSGIYSIYDAVGSGEAIVFQDGTVTRGTWNKPEISSSLTLTNGAGQPLALNAGQAWFVALPGTDRLSYH